MKTLSDFEVVAVASALRIAAKQYENYVHDLTCKPPVYERLAQQFKDQEKTALALAQIFDDADKVSVS